MCRASEGDEMNRKDAGRRMRIALLMVVGALLSNGIFADQERKAARQEYYALLLVEARVADPHAVLEFEDFDKLVVEERGIRVRTLRERDKAAQDYALREMEIQAQYQVKVEDAAVRDATQRRRNEMDADLKAASALAAPSAGQGA